MVGCFQGQPDSNVGSDPKSVQDIFMSQGACINFCRSNGAAYAITSEGSTCRCSNTAPADSNKIDDAKCDKPCMGYPFEMCGGAAHGTANVLLIGGTANIPTANNGGGSTSSSGPSSISGSSSSSSSSSNPTPSSESGTSDPSPTNNPDPGNGGKTLSSNSPEKTGSGSASAGTIAASIMAIIGFGILFGVAVAFNRRRRRRRAQAAWTENMLLPSALVHTSNDDELEGHDYTRASPIYSSNTASHPGLPCVPASPPNMHFPPPPALHPRQSGSVHMHRPSYPSPMVGPHYSTGMRGPYQPFPLPMMLAQQQQSQYGRTGIHHKELLLSSPPPFSRAPQSLQQQPARMDEEGEENQRESILSRSSMRSIRTDTLRGSIDSTSSNVKIIPSDDSHYNTDSWADDGSLQR
ncbi:hypothetical protein BGZ54_000570 [Gamsiella multidivaricata]|nr:hypothetical protein BGZ54_000570 [Gamsiella multidivaricata]